MSSLWLVNSEPWIFQASGSVVPKKQTSTASRHSYEDKAKQVNKKEMDPDPDRPSQKSKLKTTEETLNKIEEHIDR